jgi:hypothetical protein
MFSSNTSSAAGDANFVEDVFSTYLYTGNGSTQTITNEIDLAGEGGLLWVKCRNVAASHRLYDTGRGANQYLNSASTDGTNLTDTGQSFTSTGFQFASNDGTVNDSGRDYVSWTFREQPKFFDIVTYTGDGTTNQVIPHTLGSSPGCIITKRTDSTGNWATWHRSFADTKTYIYLNTTAASANVPSADAMTVSSTSFTVGSNQVLGNGSGFTYVAYLFAHNAGGFGLTGTDNVISCGSASATGVTAVTLGYEPQFCMLKRSSDTGGWFMTDTMRGWNMQGDVDVRANVADAETDRTGSGWFPSATGFTFDSTQLNGSGDYIYIAIRRGPMKVPTTGTSVYTALAGTYTQPQSLTPGFPIDMGIINKTSGSDHYVVDRLRGQAYLQTASTIAESSSPGSTYMAFDKQNSTVIDNIFGGAYTGVNWFFRRAPGFFDEVCYTGTGSATTVAHNLAAVPELMIVKKRSATDDWAVYAGDNTDFLLLNTTAATADDNTYWNDTSPTSAVFSVGTNADVNTSAANYVAYLFATCPGVSKVGSYTGTGTTLQINCGFTGGARFVLIKRTDSTGDWYVWDTARGIIAGNDPYLLLNSTAAEVTSTDYVDTFSSGFEISSTAPAAINASGGTFIFLAIA